ncbi:hypothetical protein E1A91_D07G133700v1 [Gossypium mustelinum]|uniref:Uncharacterized protein n=1 Tax=Gossypium mustelinum TaxID=34275 RepID=A0A5D2U9S3_GOSMU|nr:hypothetical protein E1A91_D07G133700v1 [Gossypium mustelinum]
MSFVQIWPIPVRRPSIAKACAALFTFRNTNLKRVHPLPPPLAGVPAYVQKLKLAHKPSPPPQKHPPHY